MNVPDYLESAFQKYGSASKSCVAATVELALSATRFAEQIHQRNSTTCKNAKRAVTELVSQRIHDTSLASRLFHIDAMVKEFLKRSQNLSGIRSQGVLFAMLPVWKQAIQDNRLNEMIKDATTLSIHTAALSNSTVAATALTAISRAIISVSNALASLGSSAKRVDIQMEFTGRLMDILKQGVGNLVDADLAEESANLQAFQIKQQLGVQALAIANAGPQSILNLFAAQPLRL